MRRKTAWDEWLDWPGGYRNRLCLVSNVEFVSLLNQIIYAFRCSFCFGPAGYHVAAVQVQLLVTGRLATWSGRTAHRLQRRWPSLSAEKCLLSVGKPTRRRQTTLLTGAKCKRANGITVIPTVNIFPFPGLGAGACVTSGDLRLSASEFSFKQSVTCTVRRQSCKNRALGVSPSALTKLYVLYARYAR